MTDIDVPTWRRIADDIRRRVDSGKWPAGTRIPSEVDLQAEYKCARETVRRAIHVLCDEGVVQVRQLGRFVRRRPAVNILEVMAGTLVAARMPTPEERGERDMPGGVPVLVVTEPDGEVGVYPADCTQVLIPLPRRRVSSY
jgi:DNA-binding transcriptional regulator YhcF (GntR family)